METSETTTNVHAPLCDNTCQGNAEPFEWYSLDGYLVQFNNGPEYRIDSAWETDAWMMAMRQLLRTFGEQSAVSVRMWAVDESTAFRFAPPVEAEPKGRPPTNSTPRPPAAASSLRERFMVATDPVAYFSTTSSSDSSMSVAEASAFYLAAPWLSDFSQPLVL